MRRFFSPLFSLTKFSSSAVATTAAITAAMALKTTNAHAEASSSSSPSLPSLPSLPSIPTPITMPTSSHSSSPSSSPSSSSSSLPFLSPSSTPSSSPSPSRPPLRSSAKYSSLHREAENLIHLNLFGGGKAMCVRPIFDSGHLDPSTMDKQVVIVPMLNCGPDGIECQVNVSSDLGTRHHFEGFCTTSGMSAGSYKYKFNHLTVKPQFQFHPMQSAMILDAGWKQKTWSAQFSSHNGMMNSITYNQSLSPSLSSSIQLAQSVMTLPQLNGGFHYKFPNSKSSLAFSKKENSYLLSYYRKVNEIPPTSLPGNSLEMSTQIHFDSKEGSTVVSGGAMWIQPTFKYGVSATTAGSLGTYLESLMGERVQMVISGEVKLDGSNQTKFGIGINIQ